MPNPARRWYTAPRRSGSARPARHPIRAVLAVMAIGACRAVIALAVIALVPLSTGAFAASASPARSSSAAAPEAGASPWAVTPQGAVRLVSAVLGTGSGASVGLGAQFRLEPHWKIYWRTPGDAGLPPVFDWTGSENLAAVDIAWPAPSRFSVSGIESAGYEGEVVLPLAVRLERPGEPLIARAAVEFLVCKDICVPQRVALDLLVLDGPADPGPLAHLINRHAARVPGDGRGVGLRLVDAAVVPFADAADAADTADGGGGGGGGEALRLAVEADPPLWAPDVFGEPPEGFSLRRPLVSLADGGRRAVLLVPLSAGAGAQGSLVGRAFSLTLVDGGDGTTPGPVPEVRAMEARPVIAATPAAGTLGPGWPSAAGGRTAGFVAAGESGATGLLAMLGLAFVGGLILNLMPCVLPVLSLKVMALVSHGGAGRHAIRRSFIASAAGIVFSFLVLAGAAVAVKAAGAAVGWGIQFQQPLFLVVMVTLLTLFAANLWGLLDIPLPRLLADLGTVGAVGTVGASSSGGAGGVTGAFLSGAFATLLATPCSAPFLGTAVGFALARGPAEILAIFTALGIGMAAPYLLVAAVPGLAVRLPRPGAWMVKVRAFFGVALAGTAAWLLAVLGAQIGPDGAGLVAALMLGVIAALGLRRRLPERLRPAASLVVILLAGGAMAAQAGAPLSAGGGGPTGGQGEVDGSGIHWAPFDEAVIAGHVAAGRVVLVDVTADWCVTCKVNKAAVLTRGAVAERLTGGRVVAMRADWTSPDPAISAYLARFGRYGIPFDIVYGPARPGGVPLPELLTSAAVIEALDRAALASGP